MSLSGKVNSNSSHIKKENSKKDTRSSSIHKQAIVSKLKTKTKRYKGKKKK